MASIAVDTTGKDFESMIDSLIEFATVQYGSQSSANRVWSDFNTSSFSRNWAELVAYMGDQLMFYIDAQSNQAYLRSATIPSFVIDIANQLGYEVPTQQAASGKLQFTFSGPATLAKFYQVSSGNIPFITTRAISSNQAGTVEVDAIQGSILTESFTAEGIQNEKFILQETDIIVDLENPNPELRSPIVVVNGTTYDIVTTQVDSAPNSSAVVRKELPDGRSALIFGDGIFGRRLIENESIDITYRIQGGTQGNVQPGTIDTLSTTVPNLASVTNLSVFSGGVDRLTLQQIKDRVPLSLKTKAGAVSLPDYADILIANFPQVLTAKAAINTVNRGIDLNIYVIPQSEEVSNITDNIVLESTLTDYIERHKTVGTKFLIKDGEPIQMSVDLEVYLDSDASRAAVEADIREKVAALFNLQTGGADSSGMKFQEPVKVVDLFDIVKNINGVARFETKKHTVIPRVEEAVASPNQDFYVSKVEIYDSVDKNEWLIATSELASPEPSNGQVSYKVFKRTRGEVTSLNEDSVTDSALDLTVAQGSAVVVSGTTITDNANVFTPGQFDNYLVVDSSNNIWRIQTTKSSSLVLSSPSLTDASIVTVPNGAYRIVKSFSGENIGIGGESFSILYNNRNTFFSQGAGFNLISTVRSPFILSEEQTNVGSFGVPVSISAANPQGAAIGDLVDIEFNGNPNLQAVDTDFVLVDNAGEVFEISSIADNDSAIASYNNAALIDDAITIVDTGDDQAISIAFESSKEVVDALLTVTLSLAKTGVPLGGLYLEIRSDNAGSPDALIATSNTINCSLLASAGSATVGFNFPSAVSLSLGSIYHLTIQGNTSYQTSYGNGDGQVDVGIDTTTLAYSPAITAEGAIRLESTGLDILASASGTIDITDNFIRSSKQASLLVKLLNNADFTTGTNRITIAGQPFTAVAGAPAPSGEFQVGATLTDTRNNLRSAINAQMVGIVSATDVSTDSFTLEADSTNYKGELGNSISIEILDAGVQNFDVAALDSLVGGIDGDKVIITAPNFLNSGLVAYTYTASTGVIAFASAVTLPAFLAGDVFKDGAGNEFPIISIDDGADTVTIAIDETVDNSVADASSGSIIRPFTYIFGEDVVVGSTSTISATNLAAVIDAQPFVTSTSALSVVTLTSDTLGNIGNTIKMEVDDAGQSNFTLSGEALAGGLDGDIVAVEGVELTPTLATPVEGQFQVDIGSLDNTLANLEQAINTHTSLTGIVTAAVNLTAQSVQVAAASSGSAGNAITLELINDSSSQITLSGDTLEGGADNKRVKSYNGAAWSDRVPDSDLIFFIGVSADSLVVISKSDSAGNQVLPQLSSAGEFDAGLGKRYYSDNSEVSFTIITRSPNSFIIGGEQVDIFGEGIVGGSAGVRVDQFIFRTSKIEDDITNLRENEIPVLDQSNLKINLLGGVN